MEEIKFVENQRINNKVAEIIEILKKEIIINFRPKSIILSGSFGRGEGTVIENSGRLRFLSDCEITIIPYTYIFNRKKLDEFELKFYERTGLKVGIWGATLSFYLLIPFFNRKIKPTIENYDIKYGSKVIYGKNYLEWMPDFKPEDIPLWEGIRLLFNRMVEALEYFSFENPSKEMVFWTNKILLACQDALLLSLRKYHHSYRKRNEMFQSLFPEYFGDLEDELPNFLDLTKKATEYKLTGVMDVDDSVKHWFDITEMCDKVFRYIIKKEMGMEFKDYLEFQEKYIEQLNIKIYSREFIASPVYQNFISLIKNISLSNEFISPKIILKIRTPWNHHIYSLIPLLYFGLPRNCGASKSYLNKIRDELLSIKNLEGSKDNIFNEFEYIKKQVVNLWNILC